jgi:hypothetical protein
MFIAPSFYRPLRQILRPPEWPLNDLSDVIISVDRFDGAISPIDSWDVNCHTRELLRDDLTTCSINPEDLIQNKELDVNERSADCTR